MGRAGCGCRECPCGFCLPWALFSGSLAPILNDTADVTPLPGAGPSFLLEEAPWCPHISTASGKGRRDTHQGDFFQLNPLLSGICGSSPPISPPGEGPQGEEGPGTPPLELALSFLCFPALPAPPGNIQFIQFLSLVGQAAAGVVFKEFGG